MIKTDTPHLYTTPTGWFTYYRRIPKNIKHIDDFKGKSFIRESLKTKDRTLAELETEKRDKWFNQLLGNAVKPKITKEKVRAIKDSLRMQDLLKEKIDPDEMKLFAEDLKKQGEYWEQLAELQKENNSTWEANETVEIEEPEYKSQAFKQNLKREAHLEAQREVVADKFDDGQGNYKKADRYDDDVIKRDIMEGDLDVELEPTFGDAVDFYIQWYNENKATNENQRSHWIGQIKSISNRIASALANGLNTPLSELDYDEIKAIAENLWPNANTRNTNMTGRMVPVITIWNQFNPKQRLTSNPFSSIVGVKPLEKDTRKRRSVSSEEYKLFWNNLEDLDNPEMKLIGMMLAYCGCPQGETAGMLRGDLKLQGNVPHLIIRNNNHRRLAKKRLERVIPLVDPIVEHWRDYVSNYFKGSNNDPLFPKYGVGKYQVQNRSKVLSAMVTNIEGGKDILSSYSLRHSFKDRCDAARVSSGVEEYFFGHITEASSKVHSDYGGYRRPERFLEDMSKIARVDQFGYIERFDDILTPV